MCKGVDGKEPGNCTWLCVHGGQRGRLGGARARSPRLSEEVAIPLRIPGHHGGGLEQGRDPRSFLFGAVGGVQRERQIGGQGTV